MSHTGSKKLTKKQVSCLQGWVESQIHGAPASLWGPAADAGRVRVSQSWMEINSYNSRHLHPGTWKLFEVLLNHTSEDLIDTFNFLLCIFKHFCVF